MREVGLPPTDDGAPKGKDTGQHMTHIIDHDGPFAEACAAFLAKHGTTLYHDRFGADDGKKRTRNAASKTKYKCPSCGSNAWAKPDSNLRCGDCQEKMESADAPEEGAG
jgi:hypothetical protein